MCNSWGGSTSKIENPTRSCLVQCAFYELLNISSKRIRSRLWKQDRLVEHGSLQETASTTAWQQTRLQSRAASKNIVLSVCRRCGRAKHLIFIRHLFPHTHTRTRTQFGESHKRTSTRQSWNLALARILRHRCRIVYMERAQVSFGTDQINTFDWILMTF